MMHSYLKKEQIMKYMKHTLFASLLISGALKAECPQELSHDEARMIANGEKYSELIRQFEPLGDMKSNVVKKGTSKLYTTPTLISQQEDTVPSKWKCTYQYNGKATKREWQFSISIPKLSIEQ
ncbi:MAG: hypothetical protein ACK5TR_06445 [Alphaproteobacteria bacterium]|jgi:hypothetical protein|nr:hypothetical protein [Alphaproteobacteria bacterium]